MVRNAVTGFNVRRAAALIMVFLAGVVGALLLLTSRVKNVPPDVPVAVKHVAPVDLRYDPPSDEGYVGTGKCAECHAEIAESYQTHPMSRSAARVDAHLPAAGPLDDEARVVGKRQVYPVEVRDGTMWHHNRMLDASGNGWSGVRRSGISIGTAASTSPSHTSWPLRSPSAMKPKPATARWCCGRWESLPTEMVTACGWKWLTRMFRLCGNLRPGEVSSRRQLPSFTWGSGRNKR